MDRIVILNGSPRAPKSNSRQYAEIFSRHCRCATNYFSISGENHLELCAALEDCSDLLLVFPLYADGIPVTLLHFLKVLQQYSPKHKPVVSVLINCGFLEYQQNDVAVDMIELFCRENGYRFGSVLKIGSGEAILNTPFRILAVKKIKKLAVSIMQKKYRTLQTTMPIFPKLFVKASTSYWIDYGKKNGITKEQMETMQIEE